MESSVTRAFRQQIERLPATVRDQAAQAYAIWRSYPHHPSLAFKRVGRRQPIYSVRIGLGHRALGLLEGDHVYWFWVGSHADYDELLKHV